VGFSQFPDTMYVKTIDTGVIEKLAGVRVNETMQLVYIVLTFFRRGTAAGSERMRLHLYGNPSFLANPVATSEWRNLADFTAGANVLGRLRFDFNREHLNPDLTYYVAMETDNYTRNGTTFYLAVKLDWPDDINIVGRSGLRGAQMRIIGYKEAS
jgi:hypothetical protein